MRPDTAARIISFEAGWTIPADSADPFVVQVAYDAALKLGADNKRFITAARRLGLIP